MRKITDEAILENIRTVAADLGHAPTAKEYATHPKRITCISNVQKHFRTWKRAYKQAGLKQEKESKTEIKKKCIDALLKVAAMLGHSPTRREYVKYSYSQVGEHVLRKIFGSFTKAKKAAGLTYIEYGKCKFSRDQFIANLKHIAADIGRAPTKREYDAHPSRIISSRTASILFGGWFNLCQECGQPIIDIKQIDKSSDKGCETIREMLLQDIFEAMLQHPETSTWNAMRKYTKHSSPTYYKYFKNVQEIKKMIEMKYGIHPYSVKKSRIHWTKEILKREFLRIEAMLNRTPRMADMEKYSIYQNIRYGIDKIYGNCTNFVIAMERIPWNNKETKVTIERDKKYCIKRLRKLIRKQDTTLWIPDAYYEACNVTWYRIQHLFHGIYNWFKEAKIPETKIPERIKYTSYNRNNITKDKLIELVMEMTRQLGHVPYADEYKNHPERAVSLTYIYRHFGSWKSIREEVKAKQAG